ncbi:MAG: FG-GAP-like repeat-containing protein [Chloroflexota bacterium]
MISWAILILPSNVLAQAPFPLNQFNPWISSESDSTFSIAWGDVDGDGDLDLAVGNGPVSDLNPIGQANKLYLNVDGVLQSDAAWVSLDTDRTEYVAWGDVDGDGDLDLAAGNLGEANKLYLNNNGVLERSASWVSNDSDRTWSVAWGDVDGDGDLDLAAGNGDHFFFGSGQPNKVYLNINGSLEQNASWQSADSVGTFSVAWGDMNGDGRLDLAAGNDLVTNTVYLNVNGTLESTASWDSIGTDRTTHVAWGDVDGDDDLDLAVSNWAGENKIYENINGSLQTDADSPWTSGEVDNTGNLGWGDVDGDGDLDLAFGGLGVNKIYLNVDGILQTTGNSPWRFEGENDTTSIAWGDVDGDGDLDLAFGDRLEPNKVFENTNGVLQTLGQQPGASTDAGDTKNLAWGDVDGDNDLDLAVSNSGANKVYLNVNNDLQPVASWISNDTDISTDVAWGDVDNDGDLDLAVSNENAPNKLYLNINGALQPAASWASSDADISTDIAWGDVDNDGDLDLAVANDNTPNKLYLNINGVLETNATWLSDDTDHTTSVAWGDLDGDGDLDLAVGNGDVERFTGSGQNNKVYVNINGALQPNASWQSGDEDDTTSVAWGDVDGDGDLDLAVANYLGVNKVYLNRNGQLQTNADNPWASGDTNFSQSVTWGDVDGDGDLDLAVGNGEINPIDPNQESDINKVYLNINGVLQTAGDNPWVSSDGDQTSSVAWGDVDGDGDLDLVVGNNGENKLYLNGRPERTFPNNPPFLTVRRPITAAITDMIVPPQRVTDNIIPISYTLFDPEEDRVRWIQGFYSLDSGRNWLPAVMTNSTTTNLTTSAAITDPSGAGDHTYYWDTFASNLFGQSNNVIFRLVAYPQSNTSAPAGTYQYTNTTPAPLQRPYASATTYPFRVRGTQIRITDGTAPLEDALVYRLPETQTRDGFPLARDVDQQPFRTDSEGYLTGRGEIASNDQLFALWPVSTTVQLVGHMDFDGDESHIRVPHFTRPDTMTIEAWVNLDEAISRGMILGWAGDTNRSAEFVTFDGDLYYCEWNGTSFPCVGGIELALNTWYHVAIVRNGNGANNVTLYINGIPAESGTVAHTINTNTLDIGAYTWNGLTDRHFNGQIDDLRIWNVALTETDIQNRMFDKLTGDEPGLIGYWPFDQLTDGTTPDLTVNQNDGLINGAEFIAGQSSGYAVYHTNIVPDTASLEGFAVTQGGVQEIVVSENQTLTLFDLSVSLEWDARNDTDFLNQLKFDLQRSSEILFDATNGQAALGKISLYHDQAFWYDADIRIYATNSLRPNATIGGVRTTVYTEVIANNPYAVTTQPYTLTFGPGQVRMGSVWNRFGEADGTIGEDWPRTLAHELGHYLFYLYDTYLGLDTDGLAVLAVGCQDTLMTDPYRDDFSEFHPSQNWTTKCAQTLQAQQWGVSDWETITAENFYPWMKAPSPNVNSGPRNFPLAFTTIVENPPSYSAETVNTPIFYTTDNTGAAAFTSKHAQAILYKEDRLIDLGRPSLDKVRAWGATPGDRLCIYDLTSSPSRLGCEIIATEDNQVVLQEKLGWQPDIIVTPVNSTTINIRVTDSDVSGLHGQLYPANDVPTDEISLSPTNVANVYTASFTLAIPSDEGYIQIWVDEVDSEVNPRREAVTSYSLGGNPGRRGLGFGRRGLGFGRRGLGFGRRGLGFGRRGLGFAPATSSDGQVILFSESTFDVGQFYALQKSNTLPTPPPWATVVGAGYRLVSSSNAPDLSGASLNFQYLGKEVPAGEEAFLTLHHWDGNRWQPLPTTLNLAFNEASAAVQDFGLYALMSSVPIPLAQPGWNLISYPINESRSVNEAFASIDDHYELVYGYEATDAANPWRIYCHTCQNKVNWLPKFNDLTHVEFGNGYWIQTTASITLYLKGATNNTAARASQNLQSPPATYFGLIASALTTEADQVVLAFIENQQCGQGKTYIGEDDKIYYMVKVSGNGPSGDACGTSEANVVFQVAGKPVAEVATWQNDQVQEINFTLSTTPMLNNMIYLPVLFR